MQTDSELFRTLSLYSRELICLHEPSGHYIFVTEASKSILGYTPDELIGLNPYNFFHPDDLTRIQEESHKPVLEGQAPNSIEYRIQRKDGVYVWLQTLTTPILNQEGRVYQLLSSSRDITEQKKLQLSLQFSEKKFSAAFFHSPVGIALASLDGKFAETNSALLSFLGYTKEELLEMSIFEVSLPEDKQDLINLFSSLKIGEIDSIFKESRYVHKNGQVIWGAMATSLIRAEDNHPMYFMIQIKNISERKRGEADLKHSNEKLTSALEFLTNQNKQLEEFNQIVSHNLRAPISNLITILELMEESADPLEKEEYFVHLKSLIANAFQTLEDLIEVVKIRKNQDIEKQVIDLEEVTEKMKSMLYGQISRQNAEIVSDFSAANKLFFPKIYLESILLNLLSNCLKYAKPNEEPFIQIQTFPSGKDIILSISDNGLGLDLNKHGQHIFKMHKVFHRNKGGKGIGLFLVKNQIESQGGTIQVRSVEGEGATFILKFKDGLVL